MAAFTLPEVPQLHHAARESSTALPLRMSSSAWRTSQPAHLAVLVLGATAALLGITYMVLHCFKTIEPDLREATVRRRLAEKGDKDADEVRSAVLAAQVVAQPLCIYISTKDVTRWPLEPC